MKSILKYIQLLFIIFVVLVFLYFFARNDRLNVVKYTEVTSKIEENVRLALITDLHSTLYGENQSQLVAEIDKSKPDIVLLVGDIYDDKRDNANSRILIKELVKKYPCYYVSGNHEYWSYKIAAIKSELQDMGVTVLEGNGKNVTVNNNSIQIFGVDDPECQRGQFGEEKDWYNELYSCNNAVDTNKYSILLSHRPERAEDYKAANFDLILSGHAHGGQFIIPFIVNGFYAPNQGFFPEYAGGEYELGNSKMIVSRGLMLTEIPRIFNPPELVIVDIKGEK